MGSKAAREILIPLGPPCQGDPLLMCQLHFHYQEGVVCERFQANNLQSWPWWMLCNWARWLSPRPPI